MQICSSARPQLPSPHQHGGSSSVRGWSPARTWRMRCSLRLTEDDTNTPALNRGYFLPPEDLAGFQGQDQTPGSELLAGSGAAKVSLVTGRRPTFAAPRQQRVKLSSERTLQLHSEKDHIDNTVITP